MTRIMLTVTDLEEGGPHPVIHTDKAGDIVNFNTTDAALAFGKAHYRSDLTLGIACALPTSFI